MNSDEFSPYTYFTRVANLWWVVCVATLVGGALGFLVFHLHPPVYEATATYTVTIDLSRFPLEGMQADLIQYNEDMAVNSTHAALLSDAVLKEVSHQLIALNLPVHVGDLLKNYTIERKHDVWELRYRSPIPVEAQTVVNTWAQVGYQAMLSWQATGLAPDYVIFDPPSQAKVSTQPVLYGRNNLILAGALIGFIVGIFLTTQRSAHLTRSSPKLPSEPS
jgi:uncharacterized protein involved in exopolysaccharide biosynthesis